MVITDFYLALVIGLLLGLVFSETTGIATGGVIVPCYLSLAIDTPEVIVSIFLVALLSYLIVEYILPKYIILFGRRHFVALLVTSIILKLLLEQIYPIMPFSVFIFRGIGIICPALIANSFAKQGIRLTTLSTLFVSGVVFLAVSIVHFI